MGQGSMGPGLVNQGFTPGTQNYPTQYPAQYPNTGISGTGLSTMPMVDQHG